MILLGHTHELVVSWPIKIVATTWSCWNAFNVCRMFLLEIQREVDPIYLYTVGGLLPSLLSMITCILGLNFEVLWLTRIFSEQTEHQQLRLVRYTKS
jgi:hypothetical protein